MFFLGPSTTEPIILRILYDCIVYYCTSILLVLDLAYIKAPFVHLFRT
jgi:hypothetical protein